MWAYKPEDGGLLFQFGRTDGYKHGDKNNKFLKPSKNEQETGEYINYINPTTSGTTYRKKIY